MITKNVLMLVILSAGMLTGLTATIQAAPVYADTEDCKKNDNNNCNDTHERSIEIDQENNCNIVNADEGNGGSAGGNNGGNGEAGDNTNDLTCENEVEQPNTGNDAFKPFNGD